MEQCVLAIDFGTTYTTAAIRRDAGYPELLEIDGDRRVPSVVLADEGSGAMLVGRRAVELAAAQPRQAVREAKRRIGEPAPILLGGRPYSVASVVGAVLRYVSEQAFAYSGCPVTQVVLTHPATWRRTRTDALRQAAGEGGLDAPVFILEPVAAALAYKDAEGSGDGLIAVYDLGGGTFDTAVLAGSKDGYVLVGEAGGDGRIGGELFDEMLAHQLGSNLDAGVWEALQSSEELDWRWAWATYRSEVRRAKEALSLNEHAELVVSHPGGLSRLSLTRAEFEATVESTLSDTVDILDGTIADAGLVADDLRGIYLVGGGSRIPLVERLLEEAFPGVPLLRQGDPKMAVALGATYVDGTVAETPRRRTRDSGVATVGSAAGVPGPSSQPSSRPTGVPSPVKATEPSPAEATEPSPADTRPDAVAPPPPPGPKSTPEAVGAPTWSTAPSPTIPMAPAPPELPAGPGSDRRRSPLVWVAAAAVVVVLGAVALAALLTGGGPAKPPVSTTTVPATATPAPSSRTTDPKTVVAALEDLLIANNGARTIVAQSVGDAQSCSLGAIQAKNRVLTAIGTRSDLLARLIALDTRPLPEGGQLQSLLKQAWSASIDADKQYVDWLSFVAANSCDGVAPQNSNFAAAGTISKQATSSKQQFADLWNSVASRFTVPPVSEGDL
ncbi:MAG: Hsp70 family protein [Acidimicrobiales bacterium]